MTLPLDIPLVSKDLPPGEIYNFVKKFIKDKKVLKELNEIVEEFNQKELEDFIFYGDFADYIDENILPDGYAFGIHEITKEIGFWKIGEDGSSLNVPYGDNKNVKKEKYQAEYLEPSDQDKNLFTGDKSKRYIIKKINSIFDRNRKEIIKLICGE